MIRLKTLLEQTDSTKMQYQIRYVDGPVFYQRPAGADKWTFIGAEEFVEKVCDGELIEWTKKKANK